MNPRDPPSLRHVAATGHATGQLDLGFLAFVFAATVTLAFTLLDEVPKDFRRRIAISS